MPDLSYIGDVEHTYIVEITSVPSLKNNYCRVDAKILFTENNDEDEIVGQQLLLYVWDSIVSNGFDLDDRYIIRSKVTLPDNRGIPYAFDYGRYLRRNGYYGMAFLLKGDFKFLGRNEEVNIYSEAMLFRQRLVELYRNMGIYGNNLSLLTAITLGDKSQLSRDTKDAFSDAGVAHILVVSGMHVGFIFALILLCLYKVRSRVFLVIGTLFGLIMLWVYALISGMSPSVMRAAFMFSMMLLLRVKGSVYSTYSALFLSAFIMMLFNPYLLFNVGFQLSYMAVLSITFFVPFIMRCFRSLTNKYPLVNKLVLPLSVTVAAQILTFPIVLYHFNQFPIYFIIANILVSFIAPVIFIIGMVSFPLSFIPYAGKVLGWILNNLLYLFNGVVTAIADLPFAVTHGYISVLECMVIYVMVLFVANALVQWKYKRYHYRSLLGIAVSVIIFLSIVFIENRLNSQCSFCVIPSYRPLCVNIFSKDENLLYVNAGTENYSVLEPLWFKYKVPEPIVVTDTMLSCNAFIFNDQKYIILRDNIFRYRRNTSSPIEVDYLVIDYGVYPSSRLFEEFILPKNVILTSGVYSSYIPMYKTILSAFEIPCFVISEQGSYVCHTP